MSVRVRNPKEFSASEFLYEGGEGIGPKIEEELNRVAAQKERIRRKAHNKAKQSTQHDGR